VKLFTQKSLMIGAVSLSLAFGIAGFTINTARADTSTTIPAGTIHGCIILKDNRALQDVYLNNNAGTTCPSDTYQAIWSITGPAGPAGPAGPTGPPGPATAGSNGLDVITFTYQNQTEDEGYVSCPASNPYLLGDGYTLPNDTYITSFSVITAAPIPAEYPAGTIYIQTSYANGAVGNPGYEVELICSK
jgi:hypothetical protein